MKKASRFGIFIIAAAAIVATGVCGQACAQTAGGKVKVEASGIRVVKDRIEEGEFGGFSAFNHFKGTTLALLLQPSEGAIIAVDGNESKLDSFTDDKGTNLLVKTKFGRGGLNGFPQISDSGKAAIVEVSGGGVPAAGSTKVMAKGLLKVTVAEEKKSIKSKATKVAEGGKLTVGDYEFSIEEAGKPDFGDEPLHVNLEIKQKIDEIAGFKFYKTDGTLIKSSSAGSSSSGFNRSWTVRKGFNLSEKVDSFVVEVEYWSKKKILAVPLNISAGIGL